MPSGIDHVVIAVADPDAAAAELTERVGLAFTAGGRHEGLGTFNKIAFLGDGYLELMGVPNPAAFYLLDMYPLLLDEFHLWHRRMGIDHSPLGSLPCC